MKYTLYIIIFLYSFPVFSCVIESNNFIKGDQGLTLFYSFNVDQVQVGRAFDLKIVFCKKGKPVKDIKNLNIDAKMPAHGHSMNYYPDVVPMGESLYRANNFLLHMPGLWHFFFEFSFEGQDQEIVFDYQL